MLSMTTLQKVKNLAEIQNDETKYDDVIEQLIKDTSAEAETYLGRVVRSDAADRTEYFSIGFCQTSLRLRAYPVTTMVSVANDASRVFPVSSLLSATQYYCDTANGEVWFDTPLISGKGVIRIIYRGGMAASTAAFMTEYPQISSAITMEVVYRFKTRQTIGMIAATVSGGSATYSQKNRFLIAVGETLDSEVRYG